MPEHCITSRRAASGKTSIDEQDRAGLLAIMAKALRDGDGQAFAYCLMGNHYHFVLQTRQANLSALMHRVNSVYSQTFNRRHDRRGHVFEGRFKAIHVDRDAYLLEVCRYVDLNPVRAHLVKSASDWPWSSYRAHVGTAPCPRWLASAELHATLTGVEPRDSEQISTARQCYAQWVQDGRGKPLWKESLRRGLYLGDEAFAERMNSQGT